MASNRTVSKGTGFLSFQSRPSFRPNQELPFEPETLLGEPLLCDPCADTTICASISSARMPQKGTGPVEESHPLDQV